MCRKWKWWEKDNDRGDEEEGAEGDFAIRGDFDKES